MNVIALLKRVLAGVFAAALAFSPASHAQLGAASGPQPHFTQPELDQMLAPIALYPDSLLSQILMASTYPLEVVEAARWSRAHPDLDGDQAVRQADRQDWDPSVKSLVAFPQILTMMDERLAWTKRLGDAFLDAEAQVMDTVQNLRERAYAAGSLRSTEHLQVERQADAILLEPASAHVVYVPYYNPVEVYGPWWWPAYPPMSWAPWPGYHARPARVAGFAWGNGISISAAFFFGGFDWHRRHARVTHVNNYYYGRPAIVHRTRDGSSVARAVNAAPGRWQHDPRHRRGAGYREASLRGNAARSGQTFDARAARSRDASLPAAISQSVQSPVIRGGTDARDRAAAGRERDPRRAERPEARRDPGERRDLRRDHRNSAHEVVAPAARAGSSAIPATTGAIRTREAERPQPPPGRAGAPRRIDAREGQASMSSPVESRVRATGENARPATVFAPAPSVAVSPRVSAPNAASRPVIRHEPAAPAAQSPSSRMETGAGPADARMSAGRPSVVPDRVRMPAPNAGAGGPPRAEGPARESGPRAARDAPGIAHKPQQR